MKLIYFTGKRYPSNTADHNYILNLAKSFHVKLGNDFRFVVCNTKAENLPDLPLTNVVVPSFVKRTIFFFFWFPKFWLSKTLRELKIATDDLKNADGERIKEKVVFFSNDQNLLCILIIWRKLLNQSFDIVADWHLLTGTWKDKYIARNSDCSITTSDKLKMVVRNLSPKSKIETVYGGVRLELFKETNNSFANQNVSNELAILRKQLNLPTDKYLIGYVGLFKTLGQEKGILTMIDSLQYLDSSNVMVFVGGKPDEVNSYTKYAETKKVVDRCIFLPIQPFEKVVQYEMAMNILVIPYPDKPHFRNFGFPMKIYEYMATKIPIIYTRLELLEEVVSDCAYGIKPDDPEELATTILQIKSNPEEASHKALLAYKKDQNYTWDAKATEIVKHLL